METEPEKQYKSPPDILWHYTTQEGLLGIIENKNLRATNIFYLNDATEYTYATRMIKEVLQCYLPYTHNGSNTTYPMRFDRSFDAATSDAKEKFLLIFQDVLKELEFKGEELEFRESYILSLTEKEDDLNQWRAYCPHNNGFCIGFSTSGLERQMTGWGPKGNDLYYNSHGQKRCYFSFLTTQGSGLGSRVSRLDKCLYLKG